MVNTQEQKCINGTDSTIALKDAGQCFHLDQITQGAGVSQRVGQKHRVTGFHIRGNWKINAAQGVDHVGYYLVWDRQPNEILANPGDILRGAGSLDTINAFPNVDNLSRFQILGRKTHSGVTALTNATTGLQTRDGSGIWHVDDFWDLSKNRLIATQVIGGDGLIGDRTTGALILLGIGDLPPSVASNLTFNFRLFFEDV